MNKTRFVLAAAACMLVMSTMATAAQRFSVATGNWGSTSTWSATSGGAPGATAPGAADDAIIEGGFTVTLEAAKSATNVTVRNASTLDAATFVMTVSGAFTLENGSTFKQGGNVTAAPGATKSFGLTSTYIFNGTQTTITSFFGPFGNLTWSAGNATPSGNLTINNNLTVTSNTFRGSTGAATTTRTHTVGGNVVIDGATSMLIGTNATAAGTGTWNITGNVTTQNGGTLRGCNTSSVADGTFSIGGNLVNNGTVEHGPGTGIFTVTFNGTVAPQSITGNAITSFQNVDVLASFDVTTSTDLTITGTLHFLGGNSGVLAIGSTTLTLNGPVINSNGQGVISSAANGTVIYNQASNGQIVATGTYGNITFSNFNKVFDAAINGSISIAGTLSPGTATGHGGPLSVVMFNGSGAQSIPPLSYGFLHLENAGIKTFLAGTTSIGQALNTSGSATADTTTNATTIDYNGPSGQSVQLNTYYNLKFSNSGTKTFTSGTHKIAGTFTIVGSAIGDANSATVEFNGSSAQAMPVLSSYLNLTVNNPAGVTLGADTTVNSTLALTSGDLFTGAFTLTMPSGAASTGAGDVQGNVKRTGINIAPLGTQLSFGNPFNRISINSGTQPTDITVNLDESAPVDFTTAVKRTYTITPNGGSGYAATLQLHYKDTDLNGNTEFILNLFRNNGSWVNQGAISHDPANNWVRQTNVTQFSAWTMADGAPTAANGTISGTITDQEGRPVSGTVVALNGSQSRKTITDVNGRYHFSKVETNGFYTVTPSRVNYSFNPANRAFSLVGNQTDAVFTGSLLGDNLNPIDTPEYFVRQQYVDILGREPDEAGFNYWSDKILACDDDLECIRTERKGVAAAFFVEQEFRQSGAFIYNLYQGALGRRPMYAEYSADRKLVVGGQTLEEQKQEFAAAFVSRGEFSSRYESFTTAESFVDALLANVQQATGVDLNSRRESLIGRYRMGSTNIESRTLVLRDVTENSAVRDANYNKAFVLVGYFGYLQRNPDQRGYDFWLSVLEDSSEAGNYSGMVCSFITSTEYQRRFSVIVSHSNAECVH